MQKKFYLDGVDMSIDVYEDRVEIKPKKGLLGFLNGQGNEVIPIKNISSVEVRECSFINAGHLMVNANGTSSKENKIVFGGFGDRKTMNETANKIKGFIFDKLSSSQSTQSNNSLAEELSKLNELKSNGIITEEEYKLAKNKLLGL